MNNFKCKCGQVEIRKYRGRYNPEKNKVEYFDSKWNELKCDECGNLLVKLGEAEVWIANTSCRRLKMYD